MRVIRQAGRDLGYLVLGGLTAVIAMITWTTGLSIAFGSIVLIVAIPVLVLAGTVFRWVAELDRQNARIVLGAPIGRSYRSPSEPGIWPLLKTTLTDPQVGRDTAWLVIHSVIGMTFAIVAVTALATTIGVAALPLWAGELPQEAVDWGGWQPDTTERRLLISLTAVPLALITLLMLRGMAAAECWLARWLLAPRGPRTRIEESAPAVMAPTIGYRPEVALPVHAAVSGLLVVTCVVIWLTTGFGYFWPAWPAMSLLLLVALHLVAVRYAAAEGAEARLRTAGEGGLAIVAFLVGAWLLSGAHAPFWPIWPAIGIAFSLALAALVVLAPWRDREELQERVASLTRSRRDTVEAQTAELRRIERDLHDGAQARLVALSMQLGRAEARLADHPEEANLIREARNEASAAIAELRDLSRGIAPPVLVDRGLVPAVEALAGRAAVPAEVHAAIEGQLPPAVEHCAYFVCAEALTNAAKHAPASRVVIRIERDAQSLLVSVADDGPGGAAEEGSGLTGLRQRVAALDGTLHVASASGEGTTISAELPCAS